MTFSVVVVVVPATRARLELNGVLSRDTEWVGSPTVLGMPFPFLIWQSFRVPTREEASRQIAERAVLVATTRDGSLRVFRDRDLTIYLATYDGVSRVEIQWPSMCRPLAVPFPPQIDDVFRQFGSTPGRAAELVAARKADFVMEPCPTAGFWAVEPGAMAALFTGFADRRLTYRLTAEADTGGRTVKLGPGLPEGHLRSGSVPELTWWNDGAWHTYSGAELTERELVATACRSMRPRVLCP